MSGGLKRKPLPAELNDALRGAVSGLPSATADAPRRDDGAGEATRPEKKERERRAPPVYQINFAGTRQMAELIATEAKKFGSTRRFIADVLQKAGYEVSKFDLNPVDSRQRVFRD